MGGTPNKSQPNPVSDLMSHPVEKVPNFATFSLSLPRDQHDGDDGDGDKDSGERDDEDEVEVGPAQEAQRLQVGRRARVLAVGARARLESRPRGPVARRQRFVEELEGI